MQLLMALKWVLILIALTVCGTLALPFLAMMVRFCPYATRVWAQNSGEHIARKCAADFIKHKR